MNIVKWVPDDEIMTLWDRWVQKHKEGSTAGSESRQEAPQADEPLQGETSESATLSQID